jgi:hypothetical protein
VITNRIAAKARRQVISSAPHIWNVSKMTQCLVDCSG